MAIKISKRCQHLLAFPPWTCSNLATHEISTYETADEAAIAAGLTQSLGVRLCLPHALVHYIAHGTAGLDYLSLDRYIMEAAACGRISSPAQFRAGWDSDHEATWRVLALDSPTTTQIFVCDGHLLNAVIHFAPVAVWRLARFGVGAS